MIQLATFLRHDVDTVSKPACNGNAWKPLLIRMATLNRKVVAVSLIAFGFCMLVAGCARIADPKPPEVHIPEAVGDLVVRQVANAMVLSFSLPGRNTDGTSAGTIRALEIFRITEKSEPGAEDAEVMPLTGESFIKQAAHIQSIPVARFSEYLHGDAFVIHDIMPTEATTAPFSMKLRYAVAFVNDRHQTVGLSNQAFIKPIPLPQAPQGLTAIVTEKGVRLNWIPPAENTDGSYLPELVGYNVYRTEKFETFPAEPLNALPLKKAEYQDEDSEFDKTYYYSVSFVGSIVSRAESARSEVLAVVTRDVFPPAPPENFMAIEGDDIITFFWIPSPSQDVVGYRIFRKKKGDVSREPLNSELIGSLSFNEQNAPQDAIYEIEAVDAQGNASTPIAVSIGQ